MPHPQRRIDGYGKPLPEITAAEVRSRYDSATNTAKRREIFQAMEAFYRAYLRAGVRGRFGFEFRIVDGTIQEAWWSSQQTNMTRLED